MRVSGPSLHARSEHLTRGLHRIAYNALAYRDGGNVARSRYRFLRDLVLNLDAIRDRAYVFDQQPILPAMQVAAAQGTRRRWSSTAEIIDGADGAPEIVRVALGPAPFFVSVRPTTTPLAAIVAAATGMNVYATIDDAA